MQIISQDSERCLLRDLRSLWQTEPEHRCLQFKFSQTDKYKEDWPDIVSDTLTEFFEDILLDVFVCQDHDVFVMNRTLTHKRVAQLLTHLKPKLGLARDEIAGLASLYEVGVDWPKLRIFVEKKLENMRLEIELAEHEGQLKLPKGTATENKISALREANKEMTKTLPKRREKRKIAEIMVIEDDPLSQRLISNALKGEYNYTIIGEGASACTTYLIKAPDVLFLDINLPDACGHDILESIFDLDPDAYIVMFSGSGDKENVLKAKKLGAKGFLAKPFTRDKLMQYIQKSPHMKGKWS